MLPIRKKDYTPAPYGIFSCVREFYDAVDNGTFDQAKLDSQDIILILKFNGLNLYYFDKTIRDDEDMVSIAVMENASAIRYASSSLQLDENFLHKIYCIQIFWYETGFNLNT